MYFLRDSNERYIVRGLIGDARCTGLDSPGTQARGSKEFTRVKNVNRVSQFHGHNLLEFTVAGSMKAEEHWNNHVLFGLADGTITTMGYGELVVQVYKFKALGHPHLSQRTRVRAPTDSLPVACRQMSCYYQMCIHQPLVLIIFGPGGYYRGLEDM